LTFILPFVVGRWVKIDSEMLNTFVWVLPFVLLALCLLVGPWVQAYRLYQEAQMQASAREKELIGKIHELEVRVGSKENRATTAARLAEFHAQGMAIRSGIVNSDDSSSVTEWEDQYGAWLHGLLSYVAENVSSAKSAYINAISSVSAATILGMKSKTTLRGKEMVILHLDARLSRLAEILHEY